MQIVSNTRRHFCRSKAEFGCGFPLSISTMISFFSELQLSGTGSAPVPACRFPIHGAMLPLSVLSSNSERMKEKSCSRSLYLLLRPSWLVFYAPPLERKLRLRLA